jgi:sugar phosphate permease
MQLGKFYEKKLFYGWWIVSACTIINILLGSFFYGFTAFFTPMREEFGWSSAETAFGFSLRSMESGVFTLIIGFFVDRIGTRKMILSGTSMIGVELILFSRIHSLLGFYSVFMFLSIGFTACGSLVSMTAIANWFIKKRGKALGFTTAGFAIGGILVPLIVSLITVYGWRATFMILGIGLLIICIPLSLIIKDRPEDYGYLPDGNTDMREEEKSDGFTLREAIRTHAFWLIALSYSLRYTGTSAVLVLAIPYLESIGFSAKISALVVTAICLFSMGGRISFG